MPVCASTGPVLGRCCQNRPSTGPVLASHSFTHCQNITQFSRLWAWIICASISSRTHRYAATNASSATSASCTAVTALATRWSTASRGPFRAPCARTASARRCSCRSIWVWCTLTARISAPSVQPRSARAHTSPGTRRRCMGTSTSATRAGECSTTRSCSTNT